jgi:pimeloyl-ACP methyl ester carboxylesterase
MLGEKTARSMDGTRIVFYDEGQGLPILMIHGGSGQAADWGLATQELTRTFRVIRIERRLYGRSGEPQSPHAIAREVEDLSAVCSHVREPVILFGHSSGGIVALEYALEPSFSLAGLALYEPPVAVMEPLGGAALIRAKESLARGKLGKAASIHLREIVRIPRYLLWLVHLTPYWKTIKSSVQEQIADTEAIEALGVGVNRYSAIETPTMLIGGTRSPAHLQERLSALYGAIPHSQVVLLDGQSHFADEKAQSMIACNLCELANQVFSRNECASQRFR